MKLFIANNLNFAYGKKEVLKNVSVKVDKPSIILLIGPNGCGKTTLLNLLSGRYKSYSPKASISYLPSYQTFHDTLTGYENLCYFGLLWHISKARISQIIQLCRLTEYQNIPYKKYSEGTKRKYEIAKYLLKDTDVYLFDEPLNALDPGYILYLKRLLVDLKSSGKIVIISSHILAELKDIMDEIWFIENKTLAIFKPKDINLIENKLRSQYELL